MEKLLEELENSDILLERQEYATRIKQFIRHLEGEAEFASQILSEKAAKNYKEAIKKWKIKLSNYDIYKQKITCPNCQETECICDEVNGSYRSLRGSVLERNAPESNPRSQAMEKVQGATGKDSDNTWSQEDLAKLF